LRGLFLIEIIFLVFTFGSLAGYCRKYGTYCLDELCLGDTALRRRILTFFPNALTVMNAMMGLLSVFFAYQGRIREAYFILIGAALFDKLDGALARRLGLTQPPDPDNSGRGLSIGGILDDISDAVSFCIVPAWIFYLCLADARGATFQDLPIGLVAWAYALLGMARLVYFTLDRHPIPGFFKGMPTPAAALLVVAPLIMFSQAVDAQTADVRFWGFFCVGNMLVAALLMNLYPIRYIHYGRVMNRHPVLISLNMILGLILAFTPYFGHFSLLCMFLYVLSPFWTWRITPEIAARETRI
jgi:phosphatidylserine synthase